MIFKRTSQWVLPMPALLLAVPPVLVLAAAGLLLAKEGMAADFLAQPSVRDGHLEAAGRLKLLAMLLLGAGMSTGVFLYGLRSLWLLEKRSALFASGLFAALMLFGILFTQGRLAEPQLFVGQHLVCSALAQAAPPATAATGEPGPGRGEPPGRATANGGAEGDGASRIDGGRDKGAEKQSAPARSPGPPGRADCSSDPYKLLSWLLMIQRWFLFLAIPAVVVGTITCLARPVGTDEADREAASLVQVDRLALFLKLAATLMVCGLLFLSALLSWPAYSLHEADLPAYRAHTQALVLYWGITYSLVIAAYYIPAALILSANIARRKEQDRTRDAGADEHLNPFALIKTGLSIFAPALVGIAGDAFNLTA